MLIKTLVVGQIETNCYVVTDEATLDCVVIDPGDESNTIMNYLEENKLKCRAVFLTHAHFDHVSAANAVLEETGAPLYICEKELPVVKSGASGRFRLPEDVRYYKDGDEIEISGLKFKVLETPASAWSAATRSSPATRSSAAPAAGRTCPAATCASSCARSSAWRSCPATTRYTPATPRPAGSA